MQSWQRIVAEGGGVLSVCPLKCRAGALQEDHYSLKEAYSLLGITGKDSHQQSFRSHTEGLKMAVD